jgi:hypothetical protein
MARKMGKKAMKFSKPHLHRRSAGDGSPEARGVPYTKL